MCHTLASERTMKNSVLILKIEYEMLEWALKRFVHDMHKIELSFKDMDN